jgi:hypothetical protein
LRGTRAISPTGQKAKEAAELGAAEKKAAKDATKNAAKEKKAAKEATKKAAKEAQEATEAQWEQTHNTNGLVEFGTDVPDDLRLSLRKVGRATVVKSTISRCAEYLSSTGDTTGTGVWSGPRPGG